MRAKKERQTRFYAIVTALTLLFLLIGCGSAEKPESTVQKNEQSEAVQIAPAAEAVDVDTETEPEVIEPEAAEEEEAPQITSKPAEKEAYSVGDSVYDGDLELVYIRSGEYKEKNAYLRPKDGNKYIFLEFAAINHSSYEDYTVSDFDFECYAGGYACETYYGGENDLSASLSPGRSTSGFLYYEVPKDEEEIEIEYSGDIFSSKKIKFLYEGEISSDFEIEKNTEASENAIHVGETVETDSLTITYLSCAVDKGNSYSKPQPGKQFVTCEFEFQNKSESDESVSYFGFKCFADGNSCDQEYFRDDGLSASISAGRKAKGTVTFEVPVDAEVVEVEYEVGFWKKTTLIFDAKIS
ncbi:MAG: DUF4352 domain-containing protein [Oscillospiraceae bacterium]|nr:DUF4352 domain-containing protein [Oscillospiraceae bacterium]